MAASAGDATSLVETALGQCEAAFIHGVHSFHGGHQSDLLIRPDALRELKERMRPKFKQRFDDDPKHWKRDGERVRRVGYYAGALAAFHAYTDVSCWVETGHLRAAMQHVAQHCKDPNNPRIRWWYCP